MSQSLVLTNTTDMMTTAASLAKSGYFQDAKDASQAFVKVLAGAELGIPPFAAMSGIHIITGKPVMGAGLIASIIKRSGKYDYRITEQSDTICSIDFYQGSEKIGSSSFTIEQARKAGVKNLDKYATNMLFARAISNGAKWHCPDVFGGPIYTDGEIQPEYTAPVVESSAEVVHDAKPTGQPRQSKRELATAMQAHQTAQVLAPDALATAEAAIDQLEKEAEGATTPEEFQALRKAIANRPGLVSLDLENKQKLLRGLIEMAMEQGIDYNEQTKLFTAREAVPAE